MFTEKCSHVKSCLQTLCSNQHSFININHHISQVREDVRRKPADPEEIWSVPCGHLAQEETEIDGI